MYTDSNMGSFRRLINALSRERAAVFFRTDTLRSQHKPAHSGGRFPVMSSYFSSKIVSYGRTNERFQSRLINYIALMEINRSRFFRIQASIEEFLWIFQQSALKKVHFDRLFESADSTNQSLVRPDCGLPLPFLSDVGVSIVDKFAQSGDHLTTPVSKFCDVCVDTLRCVHVLLLALQFEESPNGRISYVASTTLWFLRKRVLCVANKLA